MNKWTVDILALQTALLAIGAMPDDMKKARMESCLPGGRPEDQLQELIDSLIKDKYRDYISSKMKA